MELKHVMPNENNISDLHSFDQTQQQKMSIQQMKKNYIQNQKIILAG